MPTAFLPPYAVYIEADDNGQKKREDDGDRDNNIVGNGAFKGNVADNLSGKYKNQHYKREVSEKNAD